MLPPPYTILGTPGPDTLYGTPGDDRIGALGGDEALRAEVEGLLATDGGAEGMWVALRHQPLQRLGDASFLLGQLRNKRIERPRLIFPAEFREEVLAAIHRVLD